MAEVIIIYNYFTFEERFQGDLSSFTQCFSEVLSK